MGNSQKHHKKHNKRGGGGDEGAEQAAAAAPTAAAPEVANPEAEKAKAEKAKKIEDCKALLKEEDVGLLAKANNALTDLQNKGLAKAGEAQTGFFANIKNVVGNVTDKANAAVGNSKDIPAPAAAEGAPALTGGRRRRRSNKRKSKRKSISTKRKRTRKTRRKTMKKHKY